jgi:hypothetical protein
LLRVPAILPQDAPGVLNGAYEGILVGIVHDRVRNSTDPTFKRGRPDSFHRLGRSPIPRQLPAAPMGGSFRSGLNTRARPEN